MMTPCGGLPVRSKSRIAEMAARPRTLDRSRSVITRMRHAHPSFAPCRSWRARRRSATGIVLQWLPSCLSSLLYGSTGAR
jgi:hypothetical protein